MRIVLTILTLITLATPALARRCGEPGYPPCGYHDRSGPRVYVPLPRVYVGPGHRERERERDYHRDRD